MEQIKQDVEELKKVSGNVGLNASEYGGDQSVIVRFTLDTSFLTKFTARQWGIIPLKPIVIQVCVCVCLYIIL